MEWFGIPHAFLDLGIWIFIGDKSKFALNWQQFQAGSSIFKFVLFDGFYGTEPGDSAGTKELCRILLERVYEDIRAK